MVLTGTCSLSFQEASSSISCINLKQVAISYLKWFQVATVISFKNKRLKNRCCHTCTRVPSNDAYLNKALFSQFPMHVKQQEQS